MIDSNIFADCRYAVSFSPWGKGRWQKMLKDPRTVKKFTEDVDIRKTPYSTRYPALARLEQDPDVNFLSRNLVYNCGAFLTRDRGIQRLVDNFVTSADPGFAVARVIAHLPHCQQQHPSWL